MEKNIMKYKNYTCKIEYDDSMSTFFGTIIGINDLIMFEGESVNDLREAFHESVDDYLGMCKELGKIPEKEYNGVFQVRISSELHKKLAFKAERTGKKMNALVVEALEQSFDTPNFNLNDKV